MSLRFIPAKLIPLQGEVLELFVAELANEAGLPESVMLALLTGECAFFHCPAVGARDRGPNTGSRADDDHAAEPGDQH